MQTKPTLSLAPYAKIASRISAQMWACYQFSVRWKRWAWWTERPPSAAEKVGTSGDAMNRWKKSSCLGRVTRGPRESPSGKGSPGTGRAVPSIVAGVSASSSHRPSPSDIHRIRRNNIAAVAAGAGPRFFRSGWFDFASERSRRARSATARG